MGTGGISRRKTYACCAGIARLNVGVVIYVEEYTFLTPIGVLIEDKMIFMSTRMFNPVHILNHLGVITSFSVAKKVSEDDIHKFFSKGKKAGKSTEELNNILRDRVLSEIEEAVTHRKIPGLLSPEELAKEMGVQPHIINNMPELNRLIMIVGHKLTEKKYDKMSLCYFINSLVNLLGLTENDFEKFHRQNGPDTEDGDEEDGFKDA